MGRSLGQRHGRLDDNVDAYKRRLELYRELTLPMLKTLDEQNRLKIVSEKVDVDQTGKLDAVAFSRSTGTLTPRRS